MFTMSLADLARINEDKPAALSAKRLLKLLINFRFHDLADSVHQR